MPLLDYIVKIGILISMLWLAVLAIYLVISFRKKPNITNHKRMIDFAQEKIAELFEKSRKQKHLLKL